jgi:hypothetical protein
MRRITAQRPPRSYLGRCLAALIVVATATVTGCQSSASGQALAVDVRDEYRFQGWGVSLAWWAEIAGGWPGSGGLAGDASLLEALFGNPDQAVNVPPASPAARPVSYYPLGLNVLRYNIGASPVNPANSTPPVPVGCQKFRPGANIPAPQQGRSDPVNPGWDQAQLSVLQDAKNLAAADGAPGEQPILEAFANSPPWWLVANNCPAGNAYTDSLTPASDAAYANYLVAVLNALHTGEGVDFATIEPFNEPWEPAVTDSGSPAAGWWGQCWQGKNPKPCQEGANFTPASQGQVAAALCQALRTDPTPLATKVSAPDGNSPDSTLPDLGAIAHAATQYPGCLTQVSTHSYAGASRYTGTGRLAVAGAASRLPGPPSVSASEFGDGKCSQGNGPIPGAAATDHDTCSGVELATQIADDLQGLHPASWVYWTAMEGASGWGLLADTNTNLQTPASLGAGLQLTKRFYAYSQYTRFIRGGSTLYPVTGSTATPAGNSPNLRVIAATNTSKQIVIVATNPSGGTENLNLSLGGLPAPTTARITPYLTSHTTPATQDPAYAAHLRSGVLTGQVPPDSIATYVITPNQHTSSVSNAPLAGTWNESDGKGNAAFIVYQDRLATLTAPNGYCTAHVPAAAARPGIYDVSFNCLGSESTNGILVSRDQKSMSIAGGANLTPAFNLNSGDESFTRAPSGSEPETVWAGQAKPSSLTASKLQALAGTWAAGPPGDGNSSTVTFGSDGTFKFSSGVFSLFSCSGHTQVLTDGNYRLDISCTLGGEGLLPAVLGNGGQSLTIVDGNGANTRATLSRSRFAEAQ